jgi:hypothetical protein
MDQVAEELLLVHAPDRFVVTAVGPFQSVGAERASTSGQRAGKDPGARETGDALRSWMEHIPILVLEASLLSRPREMILGILRNSRSPSSRIGIEGALALSTEADHESVRGLAFPDRPVGLCGPRKSVMRVGCGTTE